MNEEEWAEFKREADAILERSLEELSKKFDEIRAGYLGDTP